MKRNSRLTIAIAAATLAALGGTAAAAQDKYALKSPGGIAFADFKGYEDWAPISSAKTDVDVPDTFSQAFVMEKDSKRFPKSGGWGYAVFNYDPKTETLTPDANSPADCGYACHTVVKAKDYVFHPYQKR